MAKEREVEHMNRFELMNEVDRLQRLLERMERTQKENKYYSDENDKLKQEIDRIQSQQVIVAQYFDFLGRQPGMEMWLDVADDLRCGRLVSPKGFERQSQRNERDRRKQPQGRRKAARRGKS